MQTQCEECVGITSLSADQSDAQTLLGYNRGHWSIETVHRILDDTNNWNEDQCRIRTGHGPENVSALCRVAITVIRRYRKQVAPTMREMRVNPRLPLQASQSPQQANCARVQAAAGKRAQQPIETCPD